MLVGIMSDSHGDVRATAEAVLLLEERGARKLFHCGDLGGENILDELAGHDCAFVWGNCDYPNSSLRPYVEGLGLTWPELPMRLELVGKRIALYHGHEPEFAAAKREAGLDYLFYGHTHRLADRVQGSCRLINPGALYRATVHTVALLDLDTDQLTFLRLDTGEPYTRASRSLAR